MSDLLSKLQDIYSDFRVADKLVIAEIGLNYTDEDVKKLDKSFTDYYYAVEDIRSKLGLILDDLQKVTQ